MADGLFTKVQDFFQPRMELKKFKVKNFYIKTTPTWSIIDIVSGSESYRIYPSDFSGDIDDAVAKLKRLETSPNGIDIVVDVTRRVLGTNGAVIRVRDLDDTVMMVKFITFQETERKKHD
jgi:hypothetical protein